MFKVIWTCGTREHEKNVYDTRRNPGNGREEFLIYSVNLGWMWAECSTCRPVEEKTND